jgi:hypothetical protein
MDSLTTEYVRKVFTVQAVRVSADNIEKVAEWCKGSILRGYDTETDETVPYIKVPTMNPQNDRHTQARIGDWVLFSGRGFKVYMHKAFMRDFELNKPVAEAA